MTVYYNLLWMVSVYTLCPSLILRSHSFVFKSVPNKKKNSSVLKVFVRYILEPP